MAEKANPPMSEQRKRRSNQICIGEIGLFFLCQLKKEETSDVKDKKKATQGSLNYKKSLRNTTHDELGNTSSSNIKEVLCMCEITSEAKQELYITMSSSMNM